MFLTSAGGRFVRLLKGDWWVLIRCGLGLI